MPIAGLIPAIMVEEDLRRLRFKDVQDSKYIEEKQLLDKSVIERKDYYKNNNVIANDEVLELLFEIKVTKHQSNRFE
jgi:hypothetical protein